MFKYKIEWFSDITDKKEIAEGFIKGDNYFEAIKNLTNQFSEGNIIDILSLYKLNICLDKEEILEIFKED